jgi:transposase-like protein
MRYSASEKFEIIELVQQSSLSIPRTLAPIGIPRSTFYDWYSRYQEGGIEALADGKPRPRRIWNKATVYRLLKDHGLITSPVKSESCWIFLPGRNPLTAEC